MKTCCRGRTWTQSRVVEGLVLFLFRACPVYREVSCVPQPSQEGVWGWTQELSSPGPQTGAPLSAAEPLWLGIENRCCEIRLKGVWPKGIQYRVIIS